MRLLLKTVVEYRITDSHTRPEGRYSEHQERTWIAMHDGRLSAEKFIKEMNLSQ